MAISGADALRQYRQLWANLDHELGRRVTLYVAVEDLHKCECHSWWGPGLLRYGRDYEGIARVMNRQLAEHKHSWCA